MLSSIPVHLIRQWCYCPRIVYYIELTNYGVSYPVWVKQGEHFHSRQGTLWQRRNLSRFDLEAGKLHQNLEVSSVRYGLHGVVDMVVETDDAVYPVEFKLDSSVKRRGAILQLAGYALIVEDHFRKRCPHGFLCEGEKRLHRIDITPELREETLSKAEAIRKMMEVGVKPDSSATPCQCTNCEYTNHCNDR